MENVGWLVWQECHEVKGEKVVCVDWKMALWFGKDGHLGLMKRDDLLLLKYLGM